MPANIRLVSTISVCTHELGLPRILQRRRSRERDLALAAIVARVLAPHSKLATARQLPPETASSTLGAASNRLSSHSTASTQYGPRFTRSPTPTSRSRSASKCSSASERLRVRKQPWRSPTTKSRPVALAPHVQIRAEGIGSVREFDVIRGLGSCYEPTRAADLFILGAPIVGSVR